MKTKLILSGLIALALGAAALGITGCSNRAHEHNDGHAHQFTCPMHPEVVRDAAGICPKCGMKLVEKK